MDIFKGIKPLDYVLAAAMVALGVVLGIANATSGDTDSSLAHQLDSHSMWMVPGFALAALPILWRRRSILGAIGVSFVITAASVPMFGWVTRCGWALPLSVALAYGVARFAGNRQNHVIGLVGIVALQTVALVKDASTGGVGPLLLAVPAAAIGYGVGLFVQSRSQKPAAEPTLSVEHAHA